MAESLDPMLKFTADSPEMHSSGYVPLLDLQVKIERRPDGSQDIDYVFFEKPVSSNKVIMEQSALSMRVKLETLEN